MANQNKRFVAPVVVIVIGLCWLLNELAILPGVDWVWTGSLAAAGILILIVEGVNKISFVLGPFLICSSIFSILRSTNVIEFNIEAPILIAILGLLMFVAEILKLPGCKIDPPDNGSEN